MVDRTTESSIAIRKRLREEYIKELYESFPSMELVPLSRDFLEGVHRSGLLVAGGRGTGKSNVAKIISSQVINDPESDTQIKISDTTQNWIHGFEPIYYRPVTEDMIIPDDVYFGEDHFLYDVELWDVDMIQDVLGAFVGIDYDVQRLFKKNDVMDNWIIWVIEEAQNLLGTYALNGKRGKRWLKIISESRNFNLNFIWIGQRLADISTKAVERCQSYLFGRMTGDNDLKKIRRICGKEAEVHKVVPRLGIGEFIYWDGSDAKKVINVPLYTSHTKPMLWNGRGRN